MVIASSAGLQLSTGLQIRMRNQILFLLFLNQNIYAVSTQKNRLIETFFSTKPKQMFMHISNFQTCLLYYKSHSLTVYPWTF